MCFSKYTQDESTCKCMEEEDSWILNGKKLQILQDSMEFWENKENQHMWIWPMKRTLKGKTAILFTHGNTNTNGDLELLLFFKYLYKN